jgi:DNA-directed RNA polymerase sigma subunit (sigma70/sigma32)
MRRRRLLEPVFETTDKVQEPPTRGEEDIELLTERLAIALERNSAELTPTERMIIERRFLQPQGERPETLESLGRVFDLSKERVRQIQIGALDKLRSALVEDPVVRSARFAHAGRPN